MSNSHIVKNNSVCLRPHGRSENILKKGSYKLYTIKLLSNHNVSQILQA